MTGAPTPPEPAIRLRGLTRRFGGIAAVRDVDLDVAPGERRAVLGPNGAGKTTLFNLIAGDYRPSAGAVELDENRQAISNNYLFKVTNGESRLLDTVEHVNQTLGFDREEYIAEPAFDRENPSCP